MLTFNMILGDEHVDQAKVRLVRHNDRRHPERPTIYNLWRAQDGTFELYQRIQGKKRFKKGDLLASFVVTPRNETLFVGLYRVNGLKKAKPGDAKDPTSRKDAAGKYLYDIRRDERLAEYIGHLIIDWGSGFRAWIQNAVRKDKAVQEIRSEVSPPIFPGFTDFRCDLAEIRTMNSAWVEVLRSVKGVYLLACKKCGRQYVGSAKGEENLWQRLLSYAENGHGGNVELKKHDCGPMQATILEIVNAAFGIEKIEESWKKKLLSREFGLNRN